MDAVVGGARQLSGGVVPTARALRRQLRLVRRPHHRGSLGDALTDAYMIVLIAALYGWAAARGLRGFFDSPDVQVTDAGARYWIAVAAALATAGLLWQGLRVFGPLLVTPAARTWVFSSPVDRADLLRPRFAALLVGAAASVGVAGLAVGFAGGAQAAELAWSASAGAVLGVAGAALGVVAQAAGREPRWAVRLGRGLVAAGVVVALVVIADHACPPDVGLCGSASLSPLSMSLTAAVGLALLPVAVVATVRAARSLGRIDRAALTGGADLASAATSAAVMLDPTIVSSLVATRRWRAVARVRRAPLPGRPTRWWPRFAQRFRVLVWADVRRRLRDRFALWSIAAMLLVMSAVAVALPVIEGPAHVILAYLVADRLTGGLRAVSRSAGLRRLLGGRDVELRLAHLVVPAVGAIAWYLVTLPVVRPLGLVDIGLMVGVVFAAYRTATRPPIRYGGPVADTPFGMIPVDLIGQVVRGPDVVAGLVLVELLIP